MKLSKLPSLRALQTFSVFGQTNSVAETAREMGLTSGAVSQQLKTLEDQTGRMLVSRRGRGAVLHPEAEIYHRLVSEGFEALYRSQYFLDRMEQSANLSISALPSLLAKWLNPELGEFQERHPGISIRLDSTHQEPDRFLLATNFRVTYGEAAQKFPFQRQLFTDIIFPVCSPDFADKHPGISDAATMRKLPLLHTDWGLGYEDLPGWTDWFASVGQPAPDTIASRVFSVSSLTIEAAVEGKGIALAQSSFVDRDLRTGRLVRLSETELKLPWPYFVCWGERMMQEPVARDFLNWIISVARNHPSQDDQRAEGQH